MDRAFGSDPEGRRFRCRARTAEGGSVTIAELARGKEEARYRVRVSGREFSVERGFFYRTLRRVPLRSVTGVWTFSTPLGRLLGACGMIVFTSGATVILIGLSPADSERLQTALLTGGED